MDRGVDEDKRATLRRFAVLGAASPLVGVAGAEAATGDSEVREAITGYLATTPGAHFSKLRDDLQLGTGEAQHHLRQLEEAETVVSESDGAYRRYFPAGRFSAFDRTALGYLRRETPRRMVVELLRDPAAGASDLAGELGVSRASVSSTASDLEAAGLLERGDGYALRNPETLLVLLVGYADSFGPAAVALAAEADGLVRYDAER